MHYLHEYDFANWLPQGFAQYHTQVLHLTGYPWDSVHQVSSACSRCQHQWSQWSLHAKRARPPPVQRKTPGTWGPARSKAGWHSMLRSWQYMTWFSMKFEIPYVQKFYTYIYIPPKATCAQVWCFNMRGGHIQLNGSSWKSGKFVPNATRMHIQINASVFPSKLAIVESYISVPCKPRLETYRMSIGDSHSEFFI